MGTTTQTTPIRLDVKALTGVANPILRVTIGRASTDGPGFDQDTTVNVESFFRPDGVWADARIYASSSGPDPRAARTRAHVLLLAAEIAEEIDAAFAEKLTAEQVVAFVRARYNDRLVRS